MKNGEALDAICLIMDAADISAEELVDHLLDNKGIKKPPERDPVKTLAAALNLAKDKTGMEDEEIGNILGVTGGAVGHWRRGRTNPTRGNRGKIYRWVRSVEQALGIELFPKDFVLDDNGDQHSMH